MSGARSGALLAMSGASSGAEVAKPHNPSSRCNGSVWLAQEAQGASGSPEQITQAEFGMAAAKRPFYLCGTNLKFRQCARFAGVPV